jgi:hypothetical protein
MRLSPSEVKKTMAMLDEGLLSVDMKLKENVFMLQDW